MSHDPNKKVNLLFACLDWRLHPQIEEYFTKNGDGCDSCITAGSVKGLIDEASRDFLLEQISISLKLHDCQSVILTMHIDCGAYGGSKSFADGLEPDHHAQVLVQAQAIVAQKFPELKIEKFLINLIKGDNGWSIIPQSLS